MRGVGESSPLPKKHRGGAVGPLVYKTEVSSRAKGPKWSRLRLEGIPACPPILRMGWGGRGWEIKIARGIFSVFSLEFSCQRDK